jgi:hypothetical protein
MINNHRLEDDLATHEAFKARLKDRAFALDAYHYLRNAIMHDDGSRHFLSQRSIGELIADLRGENENYTGFYLGDLGRNGPELESAGQHDDELAELFAEIGWSTLTVEQEVLLYRASIGRLDKAEKLKVGPTPFWFVEYFGDHYSVDGYRPGSPYSRLQFLAFTGRLDLDDAEYVSRNIFLSERAASYAVDYTP